MIHNNIILPVLKDLKGYMKYVFFDCAHPRVKEMAEEEHKNYVRYLKGSCQEDTNPEKNTQFYVYRQPELKKNPYTGEKMKVNMIPYREPQINPQSFKKYMMGCLSDYTIKVETEKDFNLLVSNKDEKDINKVLIFTKKDKAVPAIKALSAQFKDKLRIFIVHAPEEKRSDYIKQLLADYEIKDLPKMVVEQTYDVKADKILEQYGIHDYKGKDFKIA